MIRIKHFNHVPKASDKMTNNQLKRMSQDVDWEKDGKIEKMDGVKCKIWGLGVGQSVFKTHFHNNFHDLLPFFIYFNFVLSLSQI